MSRLLQWNGCVAGLVGSFLLATAALEPAGASAAQEAARGKLDAELSPTFTPAGGVFAEGIMLRLKVEAPSAVVRYALDGTEPSAKSEAYSRALSLTTATLVRARAFAGDKPVGPVVSQTYTFLDRDLEKFTSNLPLVILNTFGHEMEHMNKLPASVRFIDTRQGQSSLLLPADFDGRGEVHVRGNSSLRYLKRSYGLKTRDESGKPYSVSLLGFPQESD